jgi:hypothetical protein
VNELRGIDTPREHDHPELPAADQPPTPDPAERPEFPAADGEPRFTRAGESTAASHRADDSAGATPVDGPTFNRAGEAGVPDAGSVGAGNEPTYDRAGEGAVVQDIPRQITPADSLQMTTADGEAHFTRTDEIGSAGHSAETNHGAASDAPLFTRAGEIEVPPPGRVRVRR